MNNKIIQIRNAWQRKAINRGLTPCADQGKTQEELLYNASKRIGHLGEILFSLYIVYNSNRELYAERFLAFVADSIIAKWPWKDYYFTSTHSEQEEDESDSDPKSRIVALTPPLFFSQLFNVPNLTMQDFKDALHYYYVLVGITKEESHRIRFFQDALNYPVNAFELADIEIKEKELWDKIVLRSQ